MKFPLTYLKYFLLYTYRNVNLCAVSLVKFPDAFVTMH